MNICLIRGIFPCQVAFPWSAVRSNSHVSAIRVDAAIGLGEHPALDVLGEVVGVILTVDEAWIQLASATFV